MSLNSTLDSLFPSTMSISNSSLSSIDYPIYHFARDELIKGIPDKYSSLFAPFATYWIVSLLFHLIDISNLPIFEKYRIHEPDEVKSKNRVTVRQVLLAVFFQQAIQTGLGLYWIEDDDPAYGPFRNHAADLDKYAAWVGRIAVVALGKEWGMEVVKKYGAGVASWAYWWAVPVGQFFLAAILANPSNSGSLRRYAFGALYNHPLEGFILDTLGSVLAESGAGMTTRQAMLFFALSTWKTVDDHCGFALPWDPVQHLFGNNADYHDIHHQIGGLKKNYSQPYFIHFDVLFGTRMTRAQFLARKTDRRSPAKAIATETAPGLKEE
ncbi:sphinganine C4-monooxygenase, partial [Phenoliferia sp. Uapishka_3]